MAVSTNSYGDADDVADFVPRLTSGGVFTGSTKPTLAQVEKWIDQVSALVNSILSQYGFTVPVTETDVVNMLTLFVSEEVAAIAEGVNNSGRFGPTSKKPGGRGRFALILDDVESFIEGNATGFSRLGAARPQKTGSTIGSRSTDEGGDETFPIFQREDWGGETFEDRDT